MNESWGKTDYDLGLWPFDAMSAAVSASYQQATTAAQQAADATQQAMTAVRDQVDMATGASVPPTVYALISADKKATPGTTQDAYAMALFWLELALKRAAYDKNMAATQFLSPLREGLSAEYARIAAPWTTAEGITCNLTGFGCSTKGRAQVLDAVAANIKGSPLNHADKAQIVPVLESAARAVRIRQALPFIGLVALGAAAGTIWYKQRN